MSRRESIGDLEEKVRAGERLSFEDGLRLFRSDDLFRLGRMAGAVRRRRHGRRAYYVRNAHLNYSNVCRNSCTFCGFRRRPGEAGAWTLSLEEVFRRAERLGAAGLDELHVVGGVHPELPYDYYRRLLAGLRGRHPALHLKAFTAVEIDGLARITGWPLPRLLQDLRSAGLDSLPGGGAEIFSERFRRLHCPEKPGADRWLEIHRCWHRLGGRSTATMLYGFSETDEERVDHMLRLRSLQDETGGFTAFIPLAFQPRRGERDSPAGPTARTDLQVHAVARLLLDNIDHLKAYWVMTGVKMAQVLLSFGADDLDGTVGEERVAHMAGAESPLGLSEEELRSLILEAGYEPVRRDGLYRPLETV